MNLSALLSLLDEVEPFRRLVASLRLEGHREAVVPAAARPYIIAALGRPLGAPMLVVTSRPEMARRLEEELRAWRGDDAPVLLFPETGVLPYERLAPDAEAEQMRLRVLHHLADAAATAPLVVASVAALMYKTLPPIAISPMVIAEGDTVGMNALLSRWIDWGYEILPQAAEPGQVSRRGGILDIYPPQEDLPVRIELVGDRVESLRHYDAITQRSRQRIAAVTIGPAREGFPAPSHSLLDHLPPSTLIVLDDSDAIEQAAAEFEARAEEGRYGLQEDGALTPEEPRPHFNWDEFAEAMATKGGCLNLAPWGPGEDGGLTDAFAAASPFGGRLRVLMAEVQQMLREGNRVVIASHQARRLAELFAEEGIGAPVGPSLEAVPSPGGLALVEGSVSQGWLLKGGENLVFLTDAEIFGFVKQRRRIPKPQRELLRLEDLRVGDYAVHVDHGIGRFVGTTRIALEGIEREYLVLDYADGDKLYVPLEQMNRVSRYVGPSDGRLALHRLGDTEWARTKERVRRSVNEMAHELLSLYAARQVGDGIAFSPNTEWQAELEASFPYIETPDQVQATLEVEEDMERAKPMDRLVCGDVGYGKTEVAVRAAFKAVMDGTQVAVLVPTTVLAQQHYATFAERLAAFPVKIEVLSRFRNPAEQRQIIAGIKDGDIDICIGTHRLVQKDVAFKNLGLVIIDEEQRFGVVHKERLKQMRKEVDVLTLSATPIPRTLNMALSGIRDMSVMATPPLARVPIKTYVAERDGRLIRDAILRELDRGGQVFFVHNRVQSIGYIAQQLQELVPEASFAIGHGQMPEEELEQVMLDFVAGHHDVLVCTTIIEAGLDLPNVNTIIVNQADRLGLAQLYQLRGRVGRGAQRAYAYLFYDKGKRITDTARRRLQAIFEATELGAGFRIAMSDLEIRGAGNLLGPQQSGYIAAVGFDLYCRMLAEAVEKMKAQEGLAPPKPKEAKLPPPSIDLPLAALIPESYVSELHIRLALYRRMVEATELAEADDLAAELRDRFGELPAPARNLLNLLRLRILGSHSLVANIGAEQGLIVVRMREGVALPNRRSLERLRISGLRLGNTQVRLPMAPGWQQALLRVLETMAGETG